MRIKVITAYLTKSPIHTQYQSYMLTRRTHKVTTLLGLSFLLIVLTTYSITLGTAHISHQQIRDVLEYKLSLSSTQPKPLIETIIWNLRIPRALVAIIVGVALSVAGTSLQGLFRNPLVDPGLIGVSSGAAMGALIALAFASSMPSLPPHTLLPIFTLVGALTTTALIYRMARVNGQTHVATMLLAGIAINAIAGALVGLIITLKADNTALRSITFWTLGSFANASWTTFYYLCIPIIPGCIIMILQARKLNTLLLGEAESYQLGINVNKLKRILIFWSALVVAATVAACGIIAFIGLVIPHLARIIFGPNHRWVFPGAILIGAILTLIADLAARTAASPMEIPIGIFTALVGAPFFLGLLCLKKR